MHVESDCGNPWLSVENQKVFSLIWKQGFGPESQWGIEEREISPTSHQEFSFCDILVGCGGL